MNRLQQSREYLRQYLGARNYPWFVWPAHHDRARFCMFDLGGMASDWRTDLPYTTYYYPQKDAPPNWRNDLPYETDFQKIKEKT